MDTKITWKDRLLRIGFNHTLDFIDSIVKEACGDEWKEVAHILGRATDGAREVIAERSVKGELAKSDMKQTKVRIVSLEDKTEVDPKLQKSEVL